MSEVVDVPTTTMGPPTHGGPIPRVDPENEREPASDSSATLARGRGLPRGVQPLLVTLTSLAAALVSTWPLATRLTSAVPLGTEREASVALFNLWQLWWLADRIPHALRGYLNAPIFFPNEGVTTYTEPIPLLGAGVAPLWAFDLPPALIYNVALLAVLVLNGVFAYRVARALAVPLAPALVVSVLAVQLPYTLKVLGVLGCMSFFGMFAVLEGCIRFSRTGAVRWVAWALAGFVATFYAWQQNAVLAVPLAIGAGTLALQHRPHLPRRAVAQIAGAVIAAGIAVSALAVPTMRIHSEAGFARSEELVRALSAEPLDFITRPTANLVNVPPTRADDTAGLFPGFVLVGLAGAGAFSARRRGAPDRSWTALLVVVAAVGALLALGLNLSVGGWRPFAALRNLDAVAEIRSPFRAAALFQVCLVPLAAIALRSMRVRSIAFVAIVAISLVENATVQPLVSIPTSARSPWTKWVAAQPESTVLAHVPFPEDFTTKGFEVETRRMLAQIDHRKPMVNGYSGYFPVARGSDGRSDEAYLGFVATMQEAFPDEFLLCVLTKSLGSTHLVVDRSWLNTGSARADLEQYADFLRPAFSDSRVEIYELVVPSSRCRAPDAAASDDHDHADHQH